MITYQETLGQISVKYPDVYRIKDHPNDTSKTYQIPGFACRVGFVTSMTKNLCSSCNRLRATSDGKLKVCLLGNNEVSLWDILREHNEGQPIDEDSLQRLEAIRDSRRGLAQDPHVDPDSRLLDVNGMAVKRKKKRHADMAELKDLENTPMIRIGR